MVLNKRLQLCSLVLAITCSLASAEEKDKERNNAPQRAPTPAHVNPPPNPSRGNGGGGGNQNYNAPRSTPSTPAYAPSRGAVSGGNGAQRYEQSSPRSNPTTTRTNPAATYGAHPNGNAQSPNGGSQNAGGRTYAPRGASTPPSSGNYAPRGTSTSPSNGASRVTSGTPTTRAATTSNAPPSRGASTTAGARGTPGVAGGNATSGARFSPNGGGNGSVIGGSRSANTFAPRTATVPATRNGGATPAAARSVYTPPAQGAIASRGAGNAAVLTRAGSQTVIGQVNSARGGMKGINARPLPNGVVTTHPNGNLTLKTANAQYGVRANGSVASFTSRGQTASFRPNGAINAVHTPRMDIHRGPQGQRTILARRDDHSLIVATGRNRGYLERGYAYGGHSYIQRSYVYGGSHFDRYYSPYRFHGLLLAAYVTSAFYAPAYYGWAYDPWAAPVSYRWGFVSSPWYGYYGSYYSPYNSYPSASYWLTDYYLSQTLEANYQAQQDALEDDRAEGLGVTYSDGPLPDSLAATEATPITPELKAAIAQEVSRQLAAQQRAAAAGQDGLSSAGDLQDALQPNSVFVVAESIDASTPDQQVCGLTAGDILQLSVVPAQNDPTASLRVASSKRSDCPAGTQVELSMQDLQNMQNSMRANIDSGLATLSSQQGRDGLPAAPAGAIAPPRQVIGAGNADNGDVQALLDAQWQQANQTESQISQEVGAGQ